MNNNDNKEYLRDIIYTGKSQISILFVCLGNICRSPAAEGIMRALVAERGLENYITVDSAGTGGYHVGQLPDSRMRAHARRRGLVLNHHCRQVSVEDFARFDIIIGMDASNVSNLKRLAPSIQAEKKIFSMAKFFTGHPWFDHVPDPYYEGADGFELVLDLLYDGCTSLLNQIESSLSKKRE